MILLVFRRKKLSVTIRFDLARFADKIYKWCEASKLRNLDNATTFTERSPAIFEEFIDIAMAQMASLGICLAVLFHLDLQGWATFGIALGFTLIGGAIFSLTGKRSSQIPQEAVIGISYVVAAAAAVLLLSRAAEGDEEIKNMLVGNFCRCRRLPFQFAPKFSAGFVRSRCGLPKRFACALVGFSLLRRLRSGGDKLRSHRRRFARL